MSTPKDEADAISALEAGLAAYGTRNYGQARALLEQSRDLYVQLGDASTTATCDDALGGVLARLGDLAESEQAYLRARSHYVEANRPDKVAACDQYLASGYQQEGRLAEALERYLLARAYFEENNLLDHVATCDRELARVYSESGRDDEAAARLLTRREYLVQQNLANDIAEVDLTLGKVYTTLQRWDESESRLQASREYYAVHAPVAVGACDLALGDLFRAVSDPVKAEKYYLAARARWAEAGLELQVQNIDLRLEALHEP